MNGGQITNGFVANVLNSRSTGGVSCTAAINQLGGATPAAGVSWGSVFPTGVIPSACQDPVAIDLMRFVPSPNNGPTFAQLVPTGSDTEDQFTIRIDHRITDRQNFTAYYYFTDADKFSPYDTFEQAGANVPGFGNSDSSRYQQVNLSHTWTISNSLVNEARFTYMREGQLGFLKPQSVGAVSDSCVSPSAQPFCFTGTSDSSAITGIYGTSPKLGITPGLPPEHTGVPYINISGGTIMGNNFEGVLPQVGNTFEWSDNLTWVKGNHTFKFGADVRRARFDQTLYFDVNGEYTFDNSGPNGIIPGDGDQYAEFLLGLADAYTQGSAQSEAIRSTSVYPFVQDSWKIRPNLTLNYGLRWELDTPLTDISRHVETFRPGQNSTVHPCQLTAQSEAYFGVNSSSCDAVGVNPTGLVVPGDAGIPPAMTSTYYKAFAPRIGLAYSPGNSGKTSIRAGWGLVLQPD